MISFMELFAQITEFINSFPFASVLVDGFFLLYWVNVFFIVYHLTRFGIGPVPKLFAMLFLLGAIGLFSATMLAYSRVDFAALSANIVRWGRDSLPNDYRSPFNNSLPSIPGLKPTP